MSSSLCPPPVFIPTVSRWCARSLILTTIPMFCTPPPPSWAARPWAMPCWLPPKIYVKPVLKVLEEVDVKGISHITGGGFYENIPAACQRAACARIKKEDVRIPAHLPPDAGDRPHLRSTTCSIPSTWALAWCSLFLAAAGRQGAWRSSTPTASPRLTQLGVIAEGDGVELC